MLDANEFAALIKDKLRQYHESRIRKANDHKLANDEPRWITIHPGGKGVNAKGEEKKGRPCLIDSDTGQVIKGPPGTAGKPIKQAFKDLKQQNAKQAAAKQAAGSVPNQGAGSVPNQPPAMQQPTPANPAAQTAQPSASELEKREKAHAEAMAAKDKEIESLKQQLAKLQSAPPKAEHKKQIDMDLPDKIPDDVVLQNRSRETTSSVQQMESIARNLDYYKVGTSNDFNSGSPVVSFGSIDDKSLGKKTVLSTPSGKRLSVQYAVMEAPNVTTSNAIDGTANEKYNSNDPSFTRAIAGNGRMTGIAASYKQHPETAARYKNDLIANASEHGCDPELIKGMKNPVLVRVMSPKDVTKDIGDQTNQSQGLTLNAVEQARTDVDRLKNINSSALQTYEDGSPSIESVRKFIQALPANERAGLLTKDGQPTRTAQDRMQNAMMMNGYNNDYLVRLRGQAMNPEGKNIINALSNASRSFAGLEGGGDMDIRKDLNLVIGTLLNKNIQNASSSVWYDDMLSDAKSNEMARTIGTLVAENRKSTPRLTKIFKTIGDRLTEAKEANEFLKHNGTLGGLGFGELQSYETDRKHPMDVVKKAVEECRQEFQSKDQSKQNKKGLGGGFDFGASEKPAGGFGLGLGLDSIKLLQTEQVRSSGMNRTNLIKTALLSFFNRAAKASDAAPRLAADAEKWITTKKGPNGGGGRHFLIDTKTGTILKGGPKKMRGKPLSSAFENKAAKKERYKANRKATQGEYHKVVEKLQKGGFITAEKAAQMKKVKASKRDVKTWQDELTRLRKSDYKANQKARNKRVREIANELEDRGELHSSKADNLRKGNASKRTVATWEDQLKRSDAERKQGSK